MGEGFEMFQVQSIYCALYFYFFFPGGSIGKESALNVGDPGSVPGSEDLPEKEMTAHSSILA